MRTVSRPLTIRGAIAATLLFGFIGWAAGCVTNPATGENEFSLLSREQEVELGRQGDAEIVAQFGVYDDAAVSRYVDSLGQAIAARSDDPSMVWTFRVLDSPVINAFALPGGFVYVTRGLLAHSQTEAQLAVVLGHEIGHVTARHTARRYTSSQLASIGVGLGAILLEDVRPFLGEIEVGLQLLFLKFSRDDERQADELGVKYAAKLGYKTEDGAKFFETLKRIQDQQEGGSLPDWASTHPDPVEREQTVLRLAEQYRAQFPTDQPKGGDPEAFVPRFDEIVFGENPRHGFVSGNTFHHPDLRFQFTVPSGWAVGNFPSQVQMTPNVQQPQAAMVMSANAGTDPQAAANAFVQQSSAQVAESRQTTVNGLTAYRLISLVRTEDGTNLTALSYFIRKSVPGGTMIFTFHGYTEQSRFESYRNAFESVPTSFRELTDANILAVVPFRLDVFRAPRTDAFSALVAANSAAGVTTLDLAIMNQRQPADQVAQGTSLKQVR